ncbi:hypothetical protein [Vibrio penaeicida]|uniref:hypothetical protein n=1 Tax=Vibrio penaeicida TaxID=104609 RepID=UPI000CEA5B84|nr:hypothetical protein [Vibrio penaeicida]
MSRSRADQATTPKEDTRTPIILRRDYWDESGKRHSEGAQVNVSVTTAKALIQAGKAERADPLPGEALS